jgi:hypothetical protein
MARSLFTPASAGDAGFVKADDQHADVEASAVTTDEDATFG